MQNILILFYVFLGIKNKKTQLHIRKGRTIYVVGHKLLRKKFNFILRIFGYKK